MKCQLMMTTFKVPMSKRTAADEHVLLLLLLSRSGRQRISNRCARMSAPLWCDQCTRGCFAVSQQMATDSYRAARGIGERRQNPCLEQC